MIDAGARGYCLKGIDSKHLLLALYSLAAGATWWDIKASESIYQAIYQIERSPSRSPEFDLTPRELQVLKLIASGNSNREIAEALKHYISGASQFLFDREK